jgi:hypothetical protein
MAQFINNLYLGHDPKENWQMVPLNNTRGVTLMGGVGLNITVKNKVGFWEGVTLEEESDLKGKYERRIRLKGVQVGEYVLEARNTNRAVMAKLDLQVIREREVKIAYYSVADSGGHRANEAVAGKAEQLHNLARGIILPQANVKLTYLGYFPTRVSPKNLGDQVNVDDSSGDLRAIGSHQNAELQVYFVWDILDKDSPQVKKAGALGKPPPGLPGVTKGDVTLISTMHNKDIHKTLAHEIGHFLVLGNKDPSHDTDNPGGSLKPTDNLMYPKKPHGIYIGKKRILRYIPR